MAINTYGIGGTPAEEECAATGKTVDAQRYNRLECRAYIMALTRIYGVPPDGSQYTIKGNSHDFGTYYEVVFRFNSEVAAHYDYADKVENGLATWREAGMWAPVTYHKAQPVHVIEDIEQLDMETNPQALSAKGEVRAIDPLEA